jgi:hypothetical protein
MTKREILRWLESKRNRTLSELSEKYHIADNELKNCVISATGLPAVAEKMEALIEEAMNLYNNWKKENSEFDGLDYNKYSRASANLNEFISSKGAALKQITYHDISINTAEMLRLETEYKETRQKIHANYANVMAVVDSIHKAKDAVAYLKELGFDLTEIEAPKEPVTALAVKIDTSYLFLKKAA